MLNVMNIKKEYKQFALQCSLEVANGRVVGLIGKNGAGKTTIFKAILDLIALDDGKIEMNLKDHRHLNRVDKEKIGVVLSDSGFSEYLSVQDIADILTHLYHQFSKSDFLQQCQHFNLPLNKKISTFSTGMKAKLKVLIALSHQAKLLILDEPTAGLDVDARDEILDLLRLYIAEDEERSILMSSHISSDLEGLCDELYMIDQGKIILHEDTDVILSEYALLKMSDEQFEQLDKRYLLRYKKESYGYSCLTKEKQFYMDNDKGIIIEKGSIDNVMIMMIRGESQ